MLAIEEWFMTFARRYILSLWAFGLVVGAASAQAPGASLPSSKTEPADSPPLMSTAPSTAAGPADGSGWFVGAGFYLVQPYFQNNPAFTVFIQQTRDTTLDPSKPNTQTIAENALRADVSHHMDVAPLVWLGYMNEDGLGIRVRGWGFQEGTGQSVSLAPFAGTYKIGINSNGERVIVASGALATVTSATPLGLQAFGDTLSIQHGPEATTFSVTTKLSVQVGDLEGMQRFRTGNWDFLITGGLRYVRLDQTYNAYDAQSTSAAELRTLSSSYTFEGLGPTIAFELRRPIADSGVSVYGQCRGSLVFGAANQNAVFFGEELRNDDPNPQYATEHRFRSIPIVDLETGIEYGRAIGRTWLFGQLAVVGQQWANAGSASRSTMLNPLAVARPVVGGAPLDSNIALLGLTFRVGLNY
jgi:Legionella pneumophila major outer membrane protein precursor